MEYNFKINIGEMNNLKVATTWSKAGRYYIQSYTLTFRECTTDGYIIETGCPQEAIYRAYTTYDRPGSVRDRLAMIDALNHLRMSRSGTTLSDWYCAMDESTQMNIDIIIDGLIQ